MTKDGEIETLSAGELAFGYRHSKIQETGAVVISAKFALSPGNHEAIKQEMDRLTHLRQLKQPLNTLLVDPSLSVLSVILQVN